MAVSKNSARRRVKTGHRMDRRAQRTRWALARALMSLAPREGFDRLDIAKLAAEAGVGRSTFYKHYADKDDFLINSFAGMVRGFDAQAQAERRDYRSLLPAREVYAHVEGARAFALSIARSGEFERTQGAREDKLRAVALANLKRLYPAMPAVRREEIAVIAAGAFISLMRWWMEGGLRQSAAHMAALYEAVVERVIGGEV